MAFPARHAPAQHSVHRSFDANDYFAFGELTPGERIGPPLASRGRKVAFRVLFLLIVLTGSWVLYHGQTSWLDWRSMQATAVSWLGRIVIAGSTEQAAPPEELAQPEVAELTTKAVADEPRLLAEPPAHANMADAVSERADATPRRSVDTAAVPPEAKVAAHPVEPPKNLDPSDPYQARATAVGLHPDLSRVLLTRLSQADYRNAGIAIRTALAETPDSGVLVWPRQRKPELALFRVHFVPGAATGCRRYVVSITKDGWLTTALPMEKCDAPARTSRSG